ncbi:MAG: 7-cyano-7-deazaguanine synthase [Promethearchaeota archaeon]
MDLQISSHFNNRSKTFISLLSTGLDSPIATYLIMRQGYNCYALSFLNGREQKNENKEKIIQIGKKLVELTGQQLILHFVDYDDILEQFQGKCEQKLTCIICKRTMLLTAKQLAERYQAQFIVNGDILGEQASQTMDNLYVVHQINKNIPVIRPLIGFDKLDIIRISRKIGLYEISLLKGVSCEYNPKYPETRAKTKEVEDTEKKINRSHIQQDIFGKMEKMIVKLN